MLGLRDEIIPLDCAASSSKHQRVNPRTYKGGGGGGGGGGEVVATPSSEVPCALRNWPEIIIAPL